VHSGALQDSLKAEGLLGLYITSLRKRLELLAQEDIEAISDLIDVGAAGEQDFRGSWIVEHGAKQVFEEQELMAKLKTELESAAKS
jgi:hypothetical protein